MGALVNIFKKLFGGILGFISGLLNGKKKAIDGATVEPKLAADKAENPAKAAPKAKKGKKDKDGFYAVADESTMDELPAANAIVSTTDAVTTDAKGKKVKAAPAKAVAKVAAPMSSEDLIVAALKLNQPPAAVGAESQAPTPTAGFATQYLVPTLTSGRRSPGPSLKGFKAMAKEIRG
jgi:hypothetical protein